METDTVAGFFAGKRVLLTGGAGFVGSFLAERLVALEAAVTVADNLSTGNTDNLQELMHKEGFRFIEADVAQPTETYFAEEVDLIYHLASPASPVDFEKMPIEIYSVNGFGTHHLCDFARKKEARILFASTSEAYGDPEVHPQPETYRGNVNTTGPRACYDESKRFGEMVMSTFARKHGLDTRIVRIFNTYGPRMQRDDGRVIPTFINQALHHSPLTIHGDGSQTRSFCFVTDLVEYLLRVMAAEEAKGEVVNIGNPDEYTVKSLAEKIIELTGTASTIAYRDRPEDDPMQRRPVIDKAIALTGYKPQVAFVEGLRQTISYFQA